MNEKGNSIPLVRPAQGWNYQYETTSPGEMLLEEFLKPLGLSQHSPPCKFACLPRASAKLSAASAPSLPTPLLRLARFFGNSPEFWLNLQQMHDLSKARIELSKMIERILSIRLGLTEFD